mmetsp:Transcript_16639/g.40643  ORF Transcript_16639/g.40643 Transcript_16639/m.40643 type:complete len:231 (-) Transcript_16639:485-1177(-)
MRFPVEAQIAPELLRHFVPPDVFPEDLALSAGRHHDDSLLNLLVQHHEHRVDGGFQEEAQAHKVQLLELAREGPSPHLDAALHVGQREARHDVEPDALQVEDGDDALFDHTRPQECLLEQEGPHLLQPFDRHFPAQRRGSAQRRGYVPRVPDQYSPAQLVQPGQEPVHLRQKLSPHGFSVYPERPFLLDPKLDKIAGDSDGVGHRVLPHAQARDQEPVIRDLRRFVALTV